MSCSSCLCNHRVINMNDYRCIKIASFKAFFKQIARQINNNIIRATSEEKTCPLYRHKAVCHKLSKTFGDSYTRRTYSWGGTSVVITLIGYRCLMWAGFCVVYGVNWLKSKPGLFLLPEIVNMNQPIQSAL